MTVTSGVVTISKDSGNLIGISIGGGAPLCPCLYIVQVSFYKILKNDQLTTLVGCIHCDLIQSKKPFIDIVFLNLTL